MGAAKVAVPKLTVVFGREALSPYIPTAPNQFVDGFVESVIVSPLLPHPAPTILYIPLFDKVTLLNVKLVTLKKVLPFIELLAVATVFPFGPIITGAG